uniref:Uncharacterized protein n=1 Tax=Haemonchus contortus TaxID=6289 RepID=A0A7I5EEG0_HAECO
MAENLAGPASKSPTLQLKTQAPQVSNQVEEFAVVEVGEELERVLVRVRQIPIRVGEELEEARIAGKYRTKLFQVLESEASGIGKMLEDLKASVVGYKQFGRELFRTLRTKGIDTIDDLIEYFDTTERDGELIADICDMFQTNGREVRNVLGEVQRTVRQQSHRSPPKEDDQMDTDTNTGELERQSRNRRLEDVETAFQMRRNSMMSASQTGAPYGLPWRQRSEKLEGQAVSTPGQEASTFMALMQANACIGPGLLKGTRSENFDEFIRRFERKYRTVIMDEQVLIDILGDDHLDGRAKSVFLSLPSEVKRQGFDAVVEELRKLLANDSTAGRLRALTELRNLRRRAGQSVSEFCVVLEKLGRQANPSCRLSDRSMSMPRSC